MAPANGSAKPRRVGHSKQLSKSVVPAIPLPHVKRQAAAAAAAAAPVQTPSPDAPRSEKPAVTNGTPNVANAEPSGLGSGTDVVADVKPADDAQTSASQDGGHDGRRDAAVAQPLAPIELLANPAAHTQTEGEANEVPAQGAPGSTATVTVEPKTLEAAQPAPAVSFETPMTMNGAKAGNKTKQKPGRLLYHPSSPPGKESLF
jgi:hypothetical protein